MLCAYKELTDADDHYGKKSYESQKMPSLDRTVLLQQIIDELIEESRAIVLECGTILDLIREGKDNKDIITALSALVYMQLFCSNNYNYHVFQSLTGTLPFILPLR